MADCGMRRSLRYTAILPNIRAAKRPRVLTFSSRSDARAFLLTASFSMLRFLMCEIWLSSSGSYPLPKSHLFLAAQASHPTISASVHTDTPCPAIVCAPRPRVKERVRVFLNPFTPLSGFPDSPQPVAPQLFLRFPLLPPQSAQLRNRRMRR